MDDKAKTWFRELQSKNASRPRNRTTLARESVRYILREADILPGIRQHCGIGRQNAWDENYFRDHPKRGHNLSRFKHYVGAECRLHGKNIDVEVTAFEDECGRPSSYRFFCNLTFREEEVRYSTIRKIVSEVSKDIGLVNSL